MKLTDKRFWKFEAAMLLCGVATVCVEALKYGIKGYGKEIIGNEREKHAIPYELPHFPGFRDFPRCYSTYKEA
jgi:hypothetical protein